MSNFGLPVAANAALETDIITFCLTKPDGVTQQDLEKEFIQAPNSKCTLADVATALNNLTRNNRLTILAMSDNTYIWRPVAEDKANKLTTLTQQERIVYQTIERENNRGIWIKDLRKRTNILGQGVLEKILKSLVVRKFIKAEDSIAGKNKKVYMLYELTPSLEVSGGTFYRGHEMDLELINVLRRATTAYLTNRGPHTAEQVTDYIREVKLVNAPFTLEDIKTVLNTLVYDRQLEIVSYELIRDEEAKQAYIQKYLKTGTNIDAPYSTSSTFDDDDDADFGDSVTLLPGAKKRKLTSTTSTVSSSSSLNTNINAAYRNNDDIFDNYEIEDVDYVYAVSNTNTAYASEHFIANPCISCELIHKCKVGNVIEPATCEYFTQWLSEQF